MSERLMIVSTWYVAAGLALVLCGCRASTDPVQTSDSTVPETVIKDSNKLGEGLTGGKPAATSSTVPENLVVEELNSTGDAHVRHVRAVATGPHTWTFHVTVEHADTGWEDYADGWDVVLPGGEVILLDEDSRYTRLLLHPHVDEQPFTRSQSGIVVPEDVTSLRVRAHDIVDGFGGQEIVVDLTTAAGPGFEVVR